MANQNAESKKNDEEKQKMSEREKHEREMLADLLSHYDYDSINERNEKAKKGLDDFFENVVFNNEIPCYNGTCDELDHSCCEAYECPWNDFFQANLWMLSTNDRLQTLYDKAEPETYPSNPFRYSEVINEWVVPGSFINIVSASSLESILDEYEMFTGFSYRYRLFGKKGEEHEHSYNDVLSSMMHEPERFYIPVYAQVDYSRQEILNLAVVRERLCVDNGSTPKCPIIWEDTDDVCELKEETKRDKSWETRMIERVKELQHGQIK